MKYPVFISLFCMLCINATAQFFVQKLEQSQIQNPEKFYVVTNQGDTVRGNLRAVTLSDDLISSFNIKSGEYKLKFRIEDIKVLAVVPGQDAQFEDFALLPVLDNMKNEDFIEVLPEGGWVFFERIQLPGNRERYQLAQLLNPGFDSKVKVYAHPDAEDGGSSSINGLTLEGNRDNQHFVSVDEERPFVIGILRYKKLALEKLYGNCELLSGQKLRWKDFAEHVFTYDQKCD